MPAVDRRGSKARKDGSVKRRVVYRHVVDSAYSSERDWPTIDPALGARLLETLCTLLTPIGNHRRTCSDGPTRGRRRRVTNVTETAEPARSVTLVALERHCLFGLNACSRSLESLIPHQDSSILRKDTKSKLEGSREVPPIRVVFVCKADVGSHLLLQHFPTLCALASAAHPEVKLVPLPLGAETALGIALGLPRVGCVGLRHHDLTAPLIEMTAVIPRPTPAILNQTRYLELNVKTIETSAPIVMKKQSTETLAGGGGKG